MLTTRPPVSTSNGKVVLLHGIARSSASLAKLERALQAADFRTFNLDYPSRRYALEDLVEHVHELASGFIEQDNAPVHFVTHSMGGLVARGYVARHRPKNLGRIVMLGPPNQGSEVADLLAGTVLYKELFGPAGRQLTTFGQNALHQTRGGVDYPLGIIAGDRSVYLFASLIIQGPNDGRVSVARTTVAGMSDHLTLHVTHPLMARNPAVIQQAVHFLLHGRFHRQFRDHACGEVVRSSLMRHGSAPCRTASRLLGRIRSTSSLIGGLGAR